MPIIYRYVNFIAHFEKKRKYCETNFEKLQFVKYFVSPFENSGNSSGFSVESKVIYTKYSKHSNETNTFMGLGKAGRFGQS